MATENRCDSMSFGFQMLSDSQLAEIHHALETGVVQEHRCVPLSSPESLDLAPVLMGVDRCSWPAEKREGPPAPAGCVCAVGVSSIDGGR